MYPVEFQTQSDVNGRALCDSLMNKVKDMDSYILYAVVSVPVEMSQHLGLLCIMHYLVEVPLEPLFQAVLGRPTYCLPHLVQTANIQNSANSKGLAWNGLRKVL